MNAKSAVAPAGKLQLEIVRKDAWIPDPIKAFNPKSELGKYIKTILKYLPRDAAAELIDRVSSTLVVKSKLYLVHFRPGKRPEQLGCVGDKLVTTAGVNFIVSAWQNVVEMEIMRYHALGTGSTAAVIGDTALQTEITTAYNPDNTRATGSLTTGSGANVFRSVGTNTVDASVVNTEWGLLSQAATGGGTLFDRFVYAAVNLANGDSLQSTFDCTFTAGG